MNNLVLDLVPVFLNVAIDQLKNGRKWNDIVANEIEVTKFINRCNDLIDKDSLNALYLKLQSFEDFEAIDLKKFLQRLLNQKEQISKTILIY